MINKKIKLVVHVGLPKTGTTYLQKQCFSKLQKIYYAGKHYDESKSDKIRFALMAFLESNELNCDALRLKFLQEIMKVRREIIFISEEMILVDTPKSSWQQKLKRLSSLGDEDIFEKLRVIVVFRNPVDAAYSFYVECKHILDKKYRNYLEFIEKSNQANVFNYKEVTGVFSRLFPDQSCDIYSYEALCFQKNGVASLADFVFGETFSEISLKGVWENKKKKIDQGYFTNPMTLSQFVASQPWVQSFLKKIPRAYYKWVALRLARIKISNPVLVERLPKYEAYIEEILNASIERQARPKDGSVRYHV